MDNKKVRDGVEIDLLKVRRMLMQIIAIERKNSKTKQYSDAEMVNKVQKIIEEEVQCL